MAMSIEALCAMGRLDLVALLYHCLLVNTVKGSSVGLGACRSVCLVLPISLRYIMCQSDWSGSSATTTSC
jgi:hypothetical protein